MPAFLEHTACLASLGHGFPRVSGMVQPCQGISETAGDSDPDLGQQELLLS